MRIVDHELLKQFREAWQCELCGKRTPTGCDPAHLFAKGMGGGGQLDIRINLNALCRQCHRKWHDGHVKREVLIDVIAKREKIKSNEVEEIIRWVARQPKERAKDVQAALQSNHGILEAIRKEARMKYHPVCEVFPRISKKDREELKQSIERHGIIYPVTTWQNNTGEEVIIDGRHRHEIGIELGLTIPTHEFVGTEEEAIDHAVALNLKRRQLTSSQRAQIGARLETLKHGGDRKKNQDAKLHLEKRDEIAGNLDVSVRTIADARKVEDHAATEIIEAVEAGKVTVSDAAKVADLPEEEQREAIAKVKSGKAKTLAQAAERNGKHEPEEVKDQEGQPVPKKLRETFAAVAGFKEWRRKIENIHSELAKYVREQQPGFEMLDKELQSIQIDLRRAKEGIKFCTPHAVCPYCKASGRDCNACKKLGWVEMATYKQATKVK